MVMFKKIIFITSLAVTAAACTKVVPASGLKNESQISFQPLVANATKADYVSDATIEAKPGSFDFRVYGWYCAGNAAGDKFIHNNATKYIDGVKCGYHTPASSEKGYWEPEQVYYWPKNGKLSFEAYAPASASSDGTFDSTAEAGLVFSGYVVKELDKQYDLLYSGRTYDKIASSGDNEKYDGVDLAFKHALSAIVVKAQTTADCAGAVKLTKIILLNPYNKGTFKQNLSDGYVPDGGDVAAWSNYSHSAGSPTSYTLFDSSEGTVLNATALENGISNAILLPQAFKHSDDEHISIYVEYSIKYGSEGWLKQNGTFDLVDSATSNAIEAWEMGRRYIYTFTFDLDKVYFAPGVEDWKDIAINPITVK